MHKSSGYVRTIVAIHNLRDRAKEAVESLQEKSVSDRIHDGWSTTRRAVAVKARTFFTHPEETTCDHLPQKYSYVFRPKSRWELVLLSGTVCGIEFCYSAETAYVTPILLSLGLSIKFVTMIWCLSPLIGFFLTPMLGSLSDSWESFYGRRRPFILLLSLGIILGLILVPNGHRLGLALGDKVNRMTNETIQPPLVDTTTPVMLSDGFFNYPAHSTISTDKIYSRNVQQLEQTKDIPQQNSSIHQSNPSLEEDETSEATQLLSKKEQQSRLEPVADYLKNTHKDVRVGHLQPWSIAFTVIGTVLLDFCSDACQSPSRTYLLDVTIPEDHAAGLSTFTLMAGLGGSVGYLMGAVQWENTAFGKFFGGQVNAVFFIVTIVFVACLVSTICSFPEIPLPLLKEEKIFREYQKKLLPAKELQFGNEAIEMDSKRLDYGSTIQSSIENNGAIDERQNEDKFETTNEYSQHDFPKSKPVASEDPVEQPVLSPDDHPTLKQYLRSIIHMPNSLRILCLTNLFSWMSLVCYSLYFTDFVGECVYGGDPAAPEDSEIHKLFKNGVQFGCFGMALYSISCSIYSYFIEALVEKFGAKRIYTGGHLIYSVGMVLMAVCRHPVAVILLSPTAGIMYSTLFTMPYLLIAHYHCAGKFREDKNGPHCGIRGIGTDVAAVSSMVFLSQFILSLSMGSIVELVGSNVATVCASAILSSCGAISATQVLYLDM